MPTRRLLRVRELLRREIGETLRRELPVEEAGLISVHDVEVGGDLRVATVYVGILGSEKQQQTGLSLLLRNRSRIQNLVAHAIVLKYIPHLRFVVDDSVARGDRILQIIAELERSSTAT